jgi:hypothetical protein
LEGCPRFSAAVRPEDKLIEVNLQLRTADPVVSPHKPVLKVAGHPVGKRNDRLGAAPQTLSERLRSSDVAVAGSGERLETLESVCEDGRTVGDVSGHKVPDRGPGEIRDHFHSDPARGAPAPFHGDESQGCLASPELAAALEACLRSAHPRLVKFDLAVERFPPRVHHRSTQFVQDHPRGLVAADPELALQEQG